MGLIGMISGVASISGDGGARIVAVELEQGSPPFAIGGLDLAGGGLVGARHIGEPPHLPAGSPRIPEEGAPAEDHLVAAGLGFHRDAACIAAGGEQPGIGRRGRGGVDYSPDRGVHAVAADQQVADGLAAVGEHGPHAHAGVLGVDQALAVLDADAAGERLLVEDPVEGGALDRLAGRAVWQRVARTARAQALAVAASQRDRRGGEPRGQDGLVHAEHPQRVDSVRAYGEEYADSVGAGWVSLVDHRVDPGLLQRDRRCRACDAGADDQGGTSLGHQFCLCSVWGSLWNSAH
jgi:hypothetical protein